MEQEVEVEAEAEVEAEVRGADGLGEGQWGAAGQ